MWIALEGVLRAHWTEDIHEEWMRSLLERRPDLARSALERRRRAMEAALPDALVAGHHRHVGEIELPDPDDRHVLAAAIETGASHIITYNVSDFPDHRVVGHGVHAVHPDELLTDLLSIEPRAVIRAVRQQRAQLRNPPATVPSILATFRALGLAQFAEALEARSGELRP